MSKKETTIEDLLAMSISDIEKQIKETLSKQKLKNKFFDN